MNELDKLLVNKLKTEINKGIDDIMKVVSSLKSLKKRDLNNKLVKRKGKLYVINKKNPRMKSRQG